MNKPNLFLFFLSEVFTPLEKLLSELQWRRNRKKVIR